MTEVTKKDVEDIVVKSNEELVRMMQGEFVKVHERFNKVDDDIRYIHSDLQLIRKEVG